MTKRKVAKAVMSSGMETPGDDELEPRRSAQRVVCARLLERWVPLATSETLEIEKEGKNGPIVEESFEAGLKAATFVLKILERLARLDGLDAAEKREVALATTADPVELARRVKAVSPILVRRLNEAEGKLTGSP